MWQIGKFDQSPLEYASLAKDSITYDTATSDWKKDWPAVQAEGVRFTIDFPLEQVNGVYTLHIATVNEQPRLPIIEINVNGHVGRAYLHPDLTYDPGDGSFAYHPNYGKAAVHTVIPARFLKQGRNSLILGVLNEPASQGDEKQFSTVTYDALRLEHALGAASGASLSVKIEPTVFYKQASAGLSEVVDAFVSTQSPVSAGAADLELNGKHFRANVTAYEFGDQRISFEIPEWSGTEEARLRLPGAPRAGFRQTLTPARKWTVFVVPHTHLDVGYTDYQGKVSETQPRVLTQAAELIRQHPDFRFSMDGSWNLQQLLDTRPKSRQDEIVNLIRSGKMAMPAQYCNLLTGYASLETLYRSLYFSKELATRYGLPFEYANITDVPSYSGAYPSVLASSGVKYWAAAANNDHAPIFYHEHWNEKSPFWWEGPDGQRVLFWYSWAYLQAQTLFGLPPGLNAVRESLPIFLQAYSKPGYAMDVALLYGTQVENTDLFPSTATFATEWNQKYAYPKLNYATFPDFFHYVENRYGKQLAVYKGDGGPYWEDGIGSDAYFAAEDRTNQNRALSAEILSTVTHTIDADLNPPTHLIDDIWRNIILFAEHTWASYNSVTQPDHEETSRQLRVKDDRAERAALEIDDLSNRSLSQLADQIHVPANTIVVFNSLNWRRNALVETDLLENPSVTDLTTNKEVPLEVLSKKQGFLHVRFLASDLPSVGYKCFRISYEHNKAPAEPVSLNTHEIENQFYRIRVDEESGALSSVYDKELKRELVDANGAYKFGQALYVSGGDGNTRAVEPYLTWPEPELAVHPAAKGKVIGIGRTPWGQSIRLASSTVNIPQIETEILLPDSRKKIELRFHVRKDYTNAKEALYFAFPAAVEKPTFTYASQQGWIDPASQMFRGGSAEWFSVHQWMSVRDSNFAMGVVPLDASLASFGDIYRGKWPPDFKAKSGTLFSYAMNNYWNTNYRAGQSGDFTFRYVVTSSSTLDGSAMTRLGTEEMRPVEVNTVVSQDKAGNPQRPLPAEGKSFLETSGDGVVLVTWKRAENGTGTILRFSETTGHAAEASVRVPGVEIQSASLCSGVEDDKSNLPVTDNSIHLSLKPFEVATIRLVSK